MSTLTLTCGGLILDASSGISLTASRRMGDILLSLPFKVAVIDITRQQEIKWIWGGPAANVRERKETIDLQPLIDRGLLLEVELEDAECTTMINLAAQRFGNGESAATALALHRGWGVCTDDYTAMARLQKLAPSVPFVVTSQLLQHWATTMSVAEAELREVVQSMQLRAGFGGSERDVLARWLRQYLEAKRPS